MKLILTSCFSSSCLCCSLIHTISWSKSRSCHIDSSSVPCTASWSCDVTASCLACLSSVSPSHSVTCVAIVSWTCWDSKSRICTWSSIRASSRPTIWAQDFNYVLTFNTSWGSNRTSFSRELKTTCCRS